MPTDVNKVLKTMLKTEVRRYEVLSSELTISKIYCGYYYDDVDQCLEQTEAVTQRCYVKKVFVEISQNSQENTCPRVSLLIKLQASVLFIKKVTLARHGHRCFPVNFVKFLRTHFFIEHPWWLLLKWIKSVITKSRLGTECLEGHPAVKFFFNHKTW